MAYWPQPLRNYCKHCDAEISRFVAKCPECGETDHYNGDDDAVSIVLLLMFTALFAFTFIVVL